MGSVGPGKVKDPTTGEVFHESEMKKVYISRRLGRLVELLGHFPHSSLSGGRMAFCVQAHSVKG
jgi:hypothetical protein